LGGNAESKSGGGKGEKRGGKERRKKDMENSEPVGEPGDNTWSLAKPSRFCAKKKHQTRASKGRGVLAGGDAAL